MAMGNFQLLMESNEMMVILLMGMDALMSVLLNQRLLVLEELGILVSDSPSEVMEYMMLAKLVMT